MVRFSCAASWRAHHAENRHMPQGTTKTTVTLVSVVTDASHWCRTHACGHTDTGAVSGEPPLPATTTTVLDRLRSNSAMGKIVAPPHSEVSGYRRIERCGVLAAKCSATSSSYRRGPTIAGRGTWTCNQLSSSTLRAERGLAAPVCAGGGVRPSAAVVAHVRRRRPVRLPGRCPQRSTRHTYQTLVCTY